MKILNDTYAQEDSIGQKIYGDGLVEVIKSIDSNGSFTIGVYGEWGSGKTSLLKQIQNEIELQNNKLDEKILTVWFNPWQFVSDEHLIIPFFHTLISTLESKHKDSKFSKVKSNIEKFLLKLTNIPVALMYGLELEFKIPFLLNSKLIASKMLDHQENAKREIDESFNNSALKKVSKEYESIYYNLIKILHEAIFELDLKVTIFIDDLDRCLPEKAIQLLEGLKVLFDLPNVVFVIGVDKNIIQSGIRLRYKKLYENYNTNILKDIENKYLHKIIQFPFHLPSADSQKLKDNLLKNNLEHIEGAENYIDLIYNVLGSNPRDLKRFINSISFYHFIAKKRFETTDYKPELLIKITLIQYLFDDLFRQLEKHPHHLVRLEKIVNEIENRKDDEADILLFPNTVNKTGIPKIDQWLETGSFEIIFSILIVNDESKDINGFINIQTASKYINLTSTSLSKSISENENLYLNIPLIDEIQNRMMEIPKGFFVMGNEKTGKVNIEIKKSFSIDKYLITQSLYRKVMNNNPSFFKNDDKPVENVSWYEAVAFCNELSKLCNLDEVYEIDNLKVSINVNKKGFRLPTEAEWEYSSFEIDINDLEHKAWFHENSDKQTHEIGQLDENKNGLFDMLGNVWEWCFDFYTPKFDNKDKAFPEILNERIFHVIRGGSWVNFKNTFENGYRDKNAPNKRKNNIGFRIVLQNNN